MARNRKAQHFYVYAVINFKQRLAYIGSRGSVKPPLEDPYMGSYNKNSVFEPNKKIILSTHATRAEAYDAEREWQIKFDVAKSALFVNRGIHTTSGFSNYEIKFSDERRKLLSAIGKKRMEDENERRKKRESMKHRAKKLILKHIETGEIIEFESISDAARKLGTSNVQLSLLLRGEYKRSGSYCLPDTDTKIFDKSVTLKNSKTGECITFVNQIDAAKTIGVSTGKISDLLSGKRRSANGYCLPETDGNLITPHKKAIKLMNAFTREIFEFDKLKEAARHLGVTHGAISNLVNKKRHSCMGYVIAPETEKDYESLEHRIEMAKKLISKPKAVKIMDTITGQIYLFESQTAAAKSIGCMASNISLLMSGKYSRVKHYVKAPDTDSQDSS